MAEVNVLYIVQNSWNVTSPSSINCTGTPRDTLASADVWLRATETEISAAVRALVAREGL